MNGKPLPKEGKVKGVSLSKWRRKCDALMQEKGRLMSPKSILSGLPTQVMHHFVPKSVSARLRYDWDNLIPLTNGEHMRLHQSGDPSYEMRIVEIKGKDWWQSIKSRKIEIIKVNVGYYKEVYDKLISLK